MEMGEADFPRAIKLDFWRRSALIPRPSAKELSFLSGSETLQGCCTGLWFTFPLDVISPALPWGLAGVERIFNHSLLTVSVFSTSPGAPFLQ